MLQALLLVFSHYSLAGTSSSSQPAALRATLLGVRTQVALMRRVLRTFRCLESFSSAWTLYEGARSKMDGGALATAETWLQVAARSFNGMYLLLEAAGLPDALRVPGLRAWGPEGAAALNVEAQRFWFFALVCGLLAAVVSLLRILTSAPVSVSVWNGPRGEKAGESAGHNADEGLSLGGDGSWRSERDRLRKVAHAHRARRKQWRQQVRARSRGILRRMVADALDLVVPGAVVGWIPASSGLVGLVMLGSTYLTGLEVWERCGREVAASKRKAG